MSSPINVIDIVIVAIYLLTTLFIGIRSGMGKNVNSTMKDYALGNKDFSTFALTATLVASWVCGGSTMGLVTAIYDKGWVFGLVWLAYPLGILLTKYILASRIHYFSECYSIGDMVNQIFGNRSQILVGILSFINGIGKTVAQIVALGFVFNYLLGLNTYVGMMIGGCAIVSYAAFGGIRAVIITDIIQFAVLVIALPMTLGVALSILGGYDAIFEHTAKVQLADHNLWAYALVFLSFCVPRLYPAMVQRFLVARNTEQLYQSLNITIVIVTAIYVVMIMLGIVSVILYPAIEDSSHVFAYLIQDLMPSGLKGFIVAGLLAVIMSTADTELNTGSIALVHDVIRKLGITKYNEARLASIITFVMGMIAIIVAMQFTSILDALLFAYLLWYPVIICPLMLGIYGLKSNDKSFITTTIITAITVIIFHNTWSHNFALSTICGIIFNFVTFITCHYFFNTSWNFKFRKKYILAPAPKRKHKLN